jgi:hypothetical protein
MAARRRRGPECWGNQAIETLDGENTPGMHEDEVGSGGGILNGRGVSAGQRNYGDGITVNCGDSAFNYQIRITVTITRITVTVHLIIARVHIGPRPVQSMTSILSALSP